jgi:hypothetical protein
VLSNRRNLSLNTRDKYARSRCRLKLEARCRLIVAAQTGLGFVYLFDSGLRQHLSWESQRQLDVCKSYSARKARLHPVHAGSWSLRARGSSPVHPGRTQEELSQHFVPVPSRSLWLAERCCSQYDFVVVINRSMYNLNLVALRELARAPFVSSVSLAQRFPFLLRAVAVCVQQTQKK